MAKAARPVPEGYHTITPQLTLDNAAQPSNRLAARFSLVPSDSPSTPSVLTRRELTK